MNIEANFARRRIALGILLASSCLSPAHAQDQSAPADPVDVGQADPAAANPTAASQPGAAQAEDDSEGGIRDIVVTAQKRAESVQDVPIAVSAFASEALEERAVSSVAQLSNLTPNVTLDASVPFSGSTAVLAASIRGIGSNDFAFNIDPGVGVYLDGVYLARSVGANQDLLDIARIEILKGPQGTLFGRNTIGGAVSVVTSDPAKEFSGKGDVTIGRYDLLQVRGSVSIPNTRSFHDAGGPGCTGRRGMRVPSMLSTMRPSASASTRAEPMNSRKNGTPTIRMARPIESEAPVIAKVK
jgi:outer membrane receptor protein involved in Fe transport